MTLKEKGLCLPCPGVVGDYEGPACRIRQSTARTNILFAGLSRAGTRPCIASYHSKCTAGGIRRRTRSGLAGYGTFSTQLSRYESGKLRQENLQSLERVESRSFYPSRTVSYGLWPGAQNPLDSIGFAAVSPWSSSGPK